MDTNLTEVKFDDVVVTKDDVVKFLCPKANAKEIYMAMGIMASFKLNPFKREVHLIKYGDRPAEVVVGYEIYLKRAERTGKLKGWKAWIDKEKNLACVKIWRADWSEPFEWEVALSEFNKKQATWNQMPSFMGKKVAIAQAFRLAFPDDVGGLPYTKDENEAFIAPSKSVEAEIIEPKRASEVKEEAVKVEIIPPKTETSGKKVIAKIAKVIAVKGKEKWYIEDINGMRYVSFSKEIAEKADSLVLKDVYVWFKDVDGGFEITSLEEIKNG